MLDICRCLYYKIIMYESLKIWLLYCVFVSPFCIYCVSSYRQTRSRGAEEEYRKISRAVEQSPCSIVITDTAGNIEYVNPKFTRLTEYSFKEAIGQNPRILKTCRTSREEYEHLWKTISAGEEWQGEFQNQKKSGELYWEHATISSIKDGEGVITHYVGVKEDITERKRLEEELKGLNKSLEQRIVERTEELRNRNAALTKEISKRKEKERQIASSLKEKELLLNEVHHRVKNNLQIVSSLLDMSSMQTQNQETLALFKDARNRIDSMALIHTQLYSSERFDKIDMEIHINELSVNLLNAYSKDSTITLDINAANVFLPVTQAVPCALVLNELISNTLKYAYGKGQRGGVYVSMRKTDEGTVLLKVKDNGIGLPEALDIETSKNLGLRLVRNIVHNQLNGKIKVISNKGLMFAIEFKQLKR